MTGEVIAKPRSLHGDDGITCYAHDLAAAFEQFPAVSDDREGAVYCLRARAQGLRSVGSSPR